MQGELTAHKLKSASDKMTLRDQWNTQLTESQSQVRKAQQANEHVLETLERRDKNLRQREEQLQTQQEEIDKAMKQLTQKQKDLNKSSHLVHLANKMARQGLIDPSSAGPSQ